jgi:hypothetical protein
MVRQLFCILQAETVLWPLARLTLLLQVSHTIRVGNMSATYGKVVQDRS